MKPQIPRSVKISPEFLILLQDKWKDQIACGHNSRNHLRLVLYNDMVIELTNRACDLLDTDPNFHKWWNAGFDSKELTSSRCKDHSGLEKIAAAEVENLLDKIRPDVTID